MTPFVNHCIGLGGVEVEATIVVAGRCLMLSILSHSLPIPSTSNYGIDQSRPMHEKPHDRLLNKNTEFETMAIGLFNYVVR